MAVSNILVNTNLAASVGIVTALALSRPVFGRIDLMVSLNGAVAGLVAIAAGPDIVDHRWAAVIGAAGAGVCTVGIRVLERLKIDDEVGAIPAHLGAGVVGTLAAGVGENLFVQFVGIAAIGAFVFGVSLSIWWAIDLTLGARVSPAVESAGQDNVQLGIESFPEFLVVEEDPDPGLE